MSNRQCFYLNADADVDITADTEIPMPRFPNGLFKISELYKFYLK